MTTSLTTLESILAHPRELSEEHATVIRATLPVIGAHIDEITPVFYRTMFADNPELLRDTFNRGNQKLGAQQRALAASIATFATLLVDGRSPVDMLSRIGHKHASLGITPDQYQVVHDYLFGAIVEVLGEAITPEVAAAWDEVYWIMAAVLVDFEKALYAEAQVEPGDVFRIATVIAREDVTDSVTVFTLGGPDGEPLPDFRPGQYTSVGVVLPDGARQLRQYSLSTAPGDGTWRIGVRRVDAEVRGGLGCPAGEVSGWLHAHAEVGTTIQVTLPFGDLVLDAAGIGRDQDAAPVVLCSAGIGITPMLGMVAHLSATEDTRRVLVLHADRSPADHVLAEEVAGESSLLADAEVHTWYEQGADTVAGPGAVHRGFMDLATVELPEGAHVFLCGSTGFLQSLRPQFLEAGVPAERLHAELFAPNDWLV
ncbi:nitric oxide dioxygenase [Dietzia kunjamensis subsp. schimae]|uniref:nitric oxide dioxygenase n=1 Tax=Dietzia kunjamensis subsp. schimae TaxID=498198 RepID=A0ABY1N050_9ACTN|nr:globin domain-containing protein [Dietzia kunjamensis]MBB1014236.1 hemin transporter [Dietzia kunjamensis subsp. schimae]SMO59637.1 nitric oxide dioxygenase [Dietzia kunjamensis subsp. schimae]